MRKLLTGNLMFCCCVEFCIFESFIKINHKIGKNKKLVEIMEWGLKFMGSLKDIGLRRLYKFIIKRIIGRSVMYI